jgi:transposase, IS4 family
LRSKRPDLVIQEFYGFIMAHFAIRGTMRETALKAGEYPDQLSYVHSVRVIRRKLMVFAASPLRQGKPFMNLCLMKYWKSGWCQVVAGTTLAWSNEK